MQTAIATRPAVSLLALAGNITIESLTISRDPMPHHYTARAVILDLQPPAIIPAIVAVEDAIKAQYPRMVRTGWSAKSDGLRIHFNAWTPISSAEWISGSEGGAR
jgi:hypothetical protein